MDNRPKSLMTLYRDFLSILAEAEIVSSLNIAYEFFHKETNLTTAEWKTIFTKIEDYKQELIHYRQNLLSNPIVNQGFALTKLAEYRERTISGLRTIKRHALYAEEERQNLLNLAVENLKDSCNLLLNIIIDEIDEIRENSPNRLQYAVDVYDLKIISDNDIEKFRC